MSAMPMFVEGEGRVRGERESPAAGHQPAIPSARLTECAPLPLDEQSVNVEMAGRGAALDTVQPGDSIVGNGASCLLGCHPLNALHAQAQADHEKGLADLGTAADGITTLLLSFLKETERLRLDRSAVMAAKTMVAGADLVLASIANERAEEEARREQEQQVLACRLDCVKTWIEAGCLETAVRELAEVIAGLEGK